MKLTARTGLIGILIVTACIYGASLKNGFVNLDDPMLVTENARVLTPALSNIGYIFTHFDPELYIPVTFLTYQLETWLLGPAAWHFHLFSILLHLCAVWLVFAIVKRYAQSNLIAGITALLFAVHPINSEAVLWVSARKDVLSSTFFLASLFCFLLYRESNNMRTYILSLSLFALALLSKVTVVTLPIIFLLLVSKKADFRRLLRTIGPFILLAAVVGVIGIKGKEAIEQQFHLTDFIFMAFRSVFFYLTLLVAPLGQSAVHILKPHDVYSPLLLISIVSVGCVSWTFLRWRKRFPLALTGWIFFLATLAPSFLHYTRGNEDFMLGSERYAYLPSIGIFLIVASLWSELWKLSWITKPTRSIFVIASLMIVMVLGYLTVLRTFVFEDAVIFSIDILQKNPHDGRTWHNLGSALEAEKKPMEAEEAYTKALELKPNLADAAINLGILLLKEGRKDEGFTMLKQATFVRPDYFKTYFNLGVALQNEEKFSEAEVMYKKTIELFPEYPQAHRNLATVLGAQKKFSEAMKVLSVLATFDPVFRAEFEHLKANIRE